MADPASLLKNVLVPLVALLASSGLAAADVRIGQPAPAFSAQDITGQTHGLADYRGKIIVLEACNLACPFCANHYHSGAMQELQGELTGQGVVWFVVNSSSPKSPTYRSRAQARQEWKEQKMKATAWLEDPDGSIGKAYELKTTPHLIVIDARGNVAYSGAIDDRPEPYGDPRSARNYVREAVQRLLEGKPVAVRRTKPYGCGIKYPN